MLLASSLISDQIANEWTKTTSISQKLISYSFPSHQVDHHYPFISINWVIERDLKGKYEAYEDDQDGNCQSHHQVE